MDEMKRCLGLPFNKEISVMGLINSLKSSTNIIEVLSSNLKCAQDPTSWLV